MIKSTTNFRYDINALRAVAVIAVLLYHFKIPFFNGGFSGVDIFFVISGYLMSKIIFTGISLENFSILDFYGKRLKRIVPALLVLVVSLTIVGFFVYFPVDYMFSEKNAAASLLFLSNILYWKNSGYFDPSSETNVLLHTWSLSVEWQFYMIYPVILLVLHKFFRTKYSLKLFFIFCTFLLILISFYATTKAPSGSFYLLPTRSWEMMCGGIAYLLEGTIKNKGNKKNISLAGYISLLFCVLFLKTEMSWPGPYTLIPVLSTMLIIVANCNDFKVLHNSWIQFLGKISYSLYLWHWPVYVISNYFGLQLNIENVLIFLILSILLGYFSYKYIESINFSSNKLILVTMIITVLLTGFLSIFPINSFMFKSVSVYLANFEKVKLDKRNQFSSGCCFISSGNEGVHAYRKDECLKIETGKMNILLLGDSHAAQLSLSMKEAMEKQHINMLQASASGCIPVKRSNGYERCSDIMDYIFNDFLVKNSKMIDGVFICADWSGKAAGDSNSVVVDISNTIQYLNKLHIPFLLIGQNETYNIPYSTISAKEYEYGMNIRNSYLDADSYNINEILKKAFEPFYINIFNVKITPKLSSTNSPYMFDKNHFTIYGADLAMKKILSSPKTEYFFKKIHEKRRTAKTELSKLKTRSVDL